MRKGISMTIAIAACFGLVVASAPVAAEDAKAPSKPSMSDSPYKNGAPPITGGYTDTSQGGTKGSGDPLAIPPSVTGQKAPGGADPQASPKPKGTPSGRY